MPNESFEGNIVNGVFEAIEECLKQGNVLKLGFWSGDGAKMVRGWPTHGRMAALEIPDTEKALGCAYRSSIPEAIKAVAGQYVWGRTHKRRRSSKSKRKIISKRKITQRNEAVSLRRRYDC